MFKLFSPGRMPTHAEIAARQLEDARIELLEAERDLEAAQCRVTTLKMRVTRLTEYTKNNPVPLPFPPRTAQVWNFQSKKKKEVAA